MTKEQLFRFVMAIISVLGIIFLGMSIAYGVDSSSLSALQFGIGGVTGGVACFVGLLIVREL